MILFFFLNIYRHFIECQCNGHSTCSGSSTTNFLRRKCLKCSNNTRGERCDQCEVGYYGDPRNGGTCQRNFFNLKNNYFVLIDFIRMFFNFFTTILIILLKNFI